MELNLPAYLSVNAVMAERRIVQINHGGGEWLDNHDDDYTESWFETRLVYRNGAYNTTSGEFIGECRELTTWSEIPIEQQVEALCDGQPLLLLMPPADWYIAVVGRRGQNYTFAAPNVDSLYNKWVYGIISDDATVMAGNDFRYRTHVKEILPPPPLSATAEQEREMAEIAANLNPPATGKNNKHLPKYNHQKLEIEQVQGVWGTYYKYPTIVGRYAYPTDYFHIFWKLHVDKGEAQRAMKKELAIKI